MGIELEPRRPRDEVSDLYISLGATLEDHGEVSSSVSLVCNTQCTLRRRETKRMSPCKLAVSAVHSHSFVNLTNIQRGCLILRCKFYALLYPRSLPVLLSTEEMCRVVSDDG